MTKVKSNGNTKEKSVSKKKKKSANQDTLSLIIFLTVIALLFLGMAWMEQGSVNIGENKSGSYISENKTDEEKDWEKILTVGTITASIILVIVSGKKIYDKKKQKERQKELKVKLEEIKRLRADKNDQIAKIIAAGKSTINSRNYHKNYYKNREEEISEEYMEASVDDEEYIRNKYEYMEAETSGNRKILGFVGIIALAGIGAIIAILVM